MPSTGRNLLRVAILVATLACLIDAVPSPLAPNKQAECTTEQHRPRFHFSPKRNWLNDPNGMFWYQGLYHLYFQYAPEIGGGGGKWWGHATSRDLVSWEEHEIVLKTDHLGEIFSGSAVVDSRNTAGFRPENWEGPDPVVAIYTSAGAGGQQQSIAFSLDAGFNFTTHIHNPVLSIGKDDNFRDPKVTWQDDRWVMALAVWDRVEFFTSPNLRAWYPASAVGREPLIGRHEGVWECPDLLSFEVEGEDGQMKKLYVLLVSIGWGAPHGIGTQYFIGDLTKDEWGRVHFEYLPWQDTNWLDWGPDNYAGVTFSNEPNGRQIYMAWVANSYIGHTPTLTHRGHMTIPRQLGIRTVNSQYRLTSIPVPELDAMRNPSEMLERQGSIAPGATVQLKQRSDFENPLMELELNLDITGFPEFAICAYNDVDEEICFGLEDNRWVLDRSKSGNVGFDDHFRNTLHAHATREVNDEKTNIRIFLDVTTIEVFMDGGLATMTGVFFPTKPFDQVEIRRGGGSSGTLTMEQVKIWGLNCWFNENA